ncbi:MAG: serpin family protein [Clostridia bacterium]|nr:serpin family protein [Clostridia bacterium]
MKRFLCVLFAGLMLLACAKTPAADEPEPGADPVPAIDPSALPDFPVPEIIGYAGFSDVLSAKLLNGTKNSNLSPISVYLALAMVTEGAEGDTQAELLKLLGCKDLAELRGICGAMLNKLSISEEKSTLTFANSLWMDDHDGQLSFSDTYLHTLADVYRSEANAVDLSSTETGRQIADWIDRHTNGKIKPAPMQFDPETIAVLINTIYLKDAWRSTFSEDATEADTFHAPDRDMTVDYMQRRFNDTTIYKGDGYLRYGIPLRTVGRMTFVLPDEDVSLESLLGSPEKLHALLNGGEAINADVHVMLPKFEFRDRMELSSVLEALGAKLAFSDDACFSAMCDIPAKISRVIQESYIGVDENGVEAAAYTMVIVNGATAMEPKELPLIDFRLERPFLFVIEAYDGTALFVGTVTEPTESAQN